MEGWYPNFKLERVTCTTLFQAKNFSFKSCRVWTSHEGRRRSLLGDVYKTHKLRYYPFTLKVWRSNPSLGNKTESLSSSLFPNTWLLKTHRPFPLTQAGQGLDEKAKKFQVKAKKNYSMPIRATELHAQWTLWQSSSYPCDLNSLRLRFT